MARLDAVSKQTAQKIEKLAEAVVRSVKGGKNPFVEIPIRSLANVKFNERNERKIIFSVRKGYTFGVTQIPTDSPFELKQFFGTTQVLAGSENKLRGSRVVAFKKLEQLTNFAYEKRAKSAKFITVLEAHNGQEGELTFGSANVANGMLNATASRGGKEINVSENVERRVFLP